MMVILLGLYHPSVDIDKLKAEQANGAQIWTLNDYYMFYQFLMPDAIFQIHNPEWLPLNTDGRWAGDYRSIYNHAECPVYACWPDVGLSNEIIMDEPMMADWFPMWMYQCSVVYMLAVALHQGVNHVRLDGMQFVDQGERLYQVPYIVKAINEARKHGLFVEVPPEIEATWIDCAVEWRCVEDIAPYHARMVPTSVVRDRLKIDLP